MNRADLIAAMQLTASPPAVSVTVPNWGTVWVKPVTVEEADANTDSPAPADDGGKKRRLARAAARIMYDGDGNRLFDPSNKDDVDLLAVQPWSMLQQVLNATGGSKADDSGNSDSAANSSSTLP